MRKSIVLLAILFAAVLMNFSCDKEDEFIFSEPEGAITLYELNGVWVSTEFELSSFVYSTCTELDSSYDSRVLSGSYLLITLTFNDKDVSLSDNCSGEVANEMKLDYTRSTGKMIFSYGNIPAVIYSFDVLSYNRDDKILEIKLTTKTVSTNAPRNGIYTLKKQTS